MLTLSIKKSVVLGGLLVGALVVSALSIKPQPSEQASSEGNGSSIGTAWAYSEPTLNPDGLIELFGLKFSREYYDCAMQYYETHDKSLSLKDTFLSPIVVEECQVL